MTIAERLRLDGLQEGLQQGKEAGKARSRITYSANYAGAGNRSRNGTTSDGAY